MYLRLFSPRSSAAVYTSASARASAGSQRLGSGHHAEQPHLARAQLAKALDRSIAAELLVASISGRAGSDRVLQVLRDLLEVAPRDRRLLVPLEPR